MSAELYKTDSPITAEQRRNVNLTWDDILRQFSSLQRQIKILAGGTEVDEILAAIETAINDAETTTAELQALIQQLETKLLAAQTVINSGNTAIANANNATQEANTATTNANNATNNANTAIANANSATQAATTAAQNANDATNNANQAIANAEQATTNANNATADAVDATNLALQSVQDVLSALVDYEAVKESSRHLGTYGAGVQYVKNNEVEHLGSTWRAMQDTLGNEPPQHYTGTSPYWQLVARKGEDSLVNETVGIWRGPTAPTNGMKIWFKDTSILNGYVAYVEISEMAPLSGQNLWLRKRVV